MQRCKKAAAALLALAMIFVFTACHTPDEVVVKVGDVEIKPGVYLALLITAENQFIAKVDEKIQEEESPAMTTLEEYKKQTVDDKDFETWTRDQAMELVQKYAAVITRFNEYGLELTEEDTKSNEAVGKYYWDQQKTLYEANGVYYDSFLETITQSSMAERLFDYYYGEGGTEEIPEAELKQAFEENYVLVDTISAGLTDNEGNALAEEDRESWLNIMSGYAARINNGEAFGDIEKEYHALQGTIVEEQEQSDAEDPHALLLGGPETMNVFAKFDEIKAMEIGEAISIEVNNLAALFVRRDASEDPDYFEQKEKELRSLLKMDEFNEKNLEYGASLPITKNGSLIRYYAPKKIDLQPQ